MASGRIKGIFFSCFEHTDCTSYCSVEELTPDFCAGLSAGALVWDLSREWIMSCAAPRRREETRDSERRTERRKKKDGFMRAIPLLKGQRPACSRCFGGCDGTVRFFALHQQIPSSGIGLGTGLPRPGVIGGSKTVIVSCPLYLFVQKKAGLLASDSPSDLQQLMHYSCCVSAKADPSESSAMVLCIIPHPHPTPYSSKGHSSHSIAYSLSFMVREKREVLLRCRRLGFWKQALLSHFGLDLKLTAHIQGVRGQREWDLGAGLRCQSLTPRPFIFPSLYYLQEVLV